MSPRITQPGVYDIPEDQYHADPVAGGSLSRSEARLILDCPARYRWAKDHPEEVKPKAVFEFGTAAHRLVLGAGPDLVEVEYDSWRSNAAKDAAKEARESGAVPLLTKDFERVQAMAAALRTHPIASALFAPGTGHPEQTLVWRDHDTGVMRRVLVDWLPAWSTRRLIMADYKTANSAEPRTFARSMPDHGYDLQAENTLQAVQALGLSGGDMQAAFVFVVQEKEPPYLISVLEPDAEALMWARIRLAWAVHTYRECTATGHWPGYTEDVELVSLPGYTTHQFEAAHERGYYDIKELTA